MTNPIVPEDEIHMCACGLQAVWEYGPGSGLPSDYRCENCVPRGCACQSNELYHQMCEAAEKDSLPFDTSPPYDPQIYGLKDNEGRPLPCCDWDEIGWENHVGVVSEQEERAIFQSLRSK